MSKETPKRYPKKPRKRRWWIEWVLFGICFAIVGWHIAVLIIGLVISTRT